MAMDAGLQLLLMCSEIWVFGLDHPSEGMQAEIAFAIRHGITIKDGDEMLRRKNEPERKDELDAHLYCLPTMPKPTQQTNPSGFISLKELFDRKQSAGGRNE